MIYKAILTGLFAIFVAYAFYNAGKGEHYEKYTTSGQLITAIIWIFLTIGLWLWL